MSTFTLAVSDHFQFALILGPNIPGSYAILLFTASNLVSITSFVYNWVLFLLWLHLFILCGVISPLISSSILGTYWPGEFIFQGRIFLPFHTVHGLLKARVLKWFAIPFSSGPHFLRTLPHDLSILGGPTRQGSWFKGLDLIDKVPEELWTEVCDIVQEAVIKTIPKKKKCEKAKWLSQEAL